MTGEIIDILIEYYDYLYLIASSSFEDLIGIGINEEVAKNVLLILNTPQNKNWFLEPTDFSQLKTYLKE